VVIALLGVLISMLIIWRACDGFEAATSYIGRNLSDGVKGATLNAIGSSLPELLAASTALILYANKDGFAFGIGTTAGSAMFNSAVIPSLVIATVITIGLTTAVTVSKKIIFRDGICLLFAELGLIYTLTASELTWIHGAQLLFMYLTYIVILFGSMSSNDVDEDYEDEIEEPGYWLKDLLTLNLRAFILGSNKLTDGRAWWLLFVATCVIATACHLLVESCYIMGEALQINTYFVAVILAAAATSVPDTIISMKDAKNGEYDDAVANALGSNIFDICVGIGLPLFVYCLMTGETISLATSDSGNVAELRVLLMVITVVIFGVLFLFSDSLTRIHAVLIFSLYVSFVVYIIGRANQVEMFNEIGVGLQNTLKFIGG